MPFLLTFCFSVWELCWQVSRFGKKVETDFTKKKEKRKIGCEQWLFLVPTHIFTCLLIYFIFFANVFYHHHHCNIIIYWFLFVDHWSAFITFFSSCESTAVVFANIFFVLNFFRKATAVRSEGESKTCCLVVDRLHILYIYIFSPI